MILLHKMGMILLLFCKVIIWGYKESNLKKYIITINVQVQCKIQYIQFILKIHNPFIADRKHSRKKIIANVCFIFEVINQIIFYSNEDIDKKKLF